MNAISKVIKKFAGLFHHKGLFIKKKGIKSDNHYVMDINKLNTKEEKNIFIEALRNKSHYEIYHGEVLKGLYLDFESYYNVVFVVRQKNYRF